MYLTRFWAQIGVGEDAGGGIFDWEPSVWQIWAMGSDDTDSGRSIVEGFLATAEVVATVIEDPAVGRSWDRPSALAEMTVGELAAHLARAVNNVDTYLSDPDEGASPGDGVRRVDGPGYFLAFDDLGPDVDSDLNRAVRARARAEAAPGWIGVRDTLGHSLEALRPRLDEMDPAAPIEVLGSMQMGLADYLRTRLIEMAVHLDDLAVSVAIDPPTLPEGVSETVVADLLEIARRRHGDPALIRALTRRERDQVGALRVL